MPNSMKSGLQLLPPGRNGCGNPRPRGRKVQSTPFHTLPWMVRGGRSTPHPTWLHHHRSPFSFLVAPWIRQRIKCEEPRGHTCTLMSGPRCMERSSLPHQDDSPPVIWGFVMLGYPGGASGKEPACQRRRCKAYGFNSWVGKIPSRRAWLPTPVFLPGESHGQETVHWVAKSWTQLKGLSTHTGRIQGFPGVLVVQNHLPMQNR